MIFIVNFSVIILENIYYTESFKSNIDYFDENHLQIDITKQNTLNNENKEIRVST